MDKLISLCFTCRTMLADHYRVDVYDPGFAAPGTDRRGKRRESCENCGEKYDLRLCRIRTKPDKERGKL